MGLASGSVPGKDIIDLFEAEVKQKQFNGKQERRGTI